ncbi:MAG: histone, partial [Burkholderia sp.]|nr:histone [Burkholderia sp.]
PKKAVVKKAAPATTASTASVAPASGVKTALNPAAAWPFPTGSRP